MNKKILTAALACVLSIGGFALSAEDYTAKDKVIFDSDGSVFSSRMSESLKIVAVDASNKAVGQQSLTEKLVSLSNYNGKSFGVMKNGSQFIPLGGASVETIGNLDVASVSLGKFEPGESFQLGFANPDGSGFEAYESVSSVKDLQAAGKSVTVNGDPLYYAGYNADSFYHLDFAEDPFNGNIEVLVMGEPLPPSTVTLIVALGLGAAFLLYKNRRQRARAEQA